MARLLDTTDNQEDRGTETETLEALPLIEEEQPAIEVEETAEEIPEKYQNKSVTELVRMHQEAEKVIGKQGSEVGDLRGMVDQYIKEQLVTQAPQEQAVQTQEEDVDWFSDPDAALEQRMARNPTIKKMEAQAARSAQEANRVSLEHKHPDYKEIMQDGEFANWIKGSKTRTRLFIEADQSYNADSADELFSTWKERKQLAAATVNADKATRKEELRQAATGGARGSDSPTAKKKYRRNDIINLMTNDPERYKQLAPEILLAYKEKRVV